MIATEHGPIVVDLFEEDAPRHAASFKKLVREGFFNGLSFHHVIDGFMAQGGTLQGPGANGPEATIPAEIGRKHVRGSVAASRKTFGNPRKASSPGQFYVCFAAQPGLDGEYTVFGQVVEGMDVVDRLKKGTGLNGAMVPPGSGDKMLKAEVLEGEAAPPSAK